LARPLTPDLRRPWEKRPDPARPLSPGRVRRPREVIRVAAWRPGLQAGGGCQGLRLDHCGPTLDQAVSQAARRRLLRNARASRRTASSVSAIAASVITAASTSPVLAEDLVPSPGAPAQTRPPWPTLG